MYEQFFGLTDKPFSLTPNTRFVFSSTQYAEVETQVMYGIDNREGLMLVTGQPGTGKTMLCRGLVERLDRDKNPNALVFSPFLTGSEMLAVLLREFGIPVPDNGSYHDLLDRLHQFLLAKLALGKRCVAIFDEAQDLPPETLEQIRVLTNLETDHEKLIQILLVGQPELHQILRAPRLAQLEQRVSIRSALGEYDEQETCRYVLHRLEVAGADGQVRLGSRTLREIHRGSHGVPRLINLVADRALLAGFAAQTRTIEPEHVRKALAALRGEDGVTRRGLATGPRRWRRRAMTVVGDAMRQAARTQGDQPRRPSKPLGTIVVPPKRYRGRGRSRLFAVAGITVVTGASALGASMLTLRAPTHSPADLFAERELSAAPVRVAHAVTAAQPKAPPPAETLHATPRPPAGLDARDALLRQGVAYQAVGDTAAARKVFERAIAAHPANPTAHYAMGQFLQTQHEVAAAIRQYQRFVDLARNTYPADTIAAVKDHIAALRKTLP